MIQNATLLRVLTLIFLGFGLCAPALAQCDSTRLGIYADYCYTNALFPDMQVSYQEDAPMLKLVNGKKEKALPVYIDSLYTEKADWLLTLARTKKLKVSAEEIVLLSLAEEVWRVEKKRIGFAFEESGLGIKILSKGSGAIPETGTTVKVHYTGYLEDGTKFDSSLDRGQPFSFAVGMGRVIKGWDEGVSKLPAGTKAMLLIPADLGYGSRGAGGVIPPEATLFFEIEILED